jgi:uncharacterized protein YmfQ (DUF2313 family)
MSTSSFAGVTRMVAVEESSKANAELLIRTLTQTPIVDDDELPVESAETVPTITECFEITTGDTGEYRIGRFVSKPRAGSHYIQYYLALAVRVGYNIECIYNRGRLVSLINNTDKSVVCMSTGEKSQVTSDWKHKIAQCGREYDVCETCGVIVNSLDTNTGCNCDE